MARSMWQQIVKRINTEYERRLRIASDLAPDGTTIHHHDQHAADTPMLIVEQAQEDYPNATSTVLIATRRAVAPQPCQIHHHPKIPPPIQTLTMML